MKLKSLILFLLMLVTQLFAQSAIEKIKKTYPNWRTNFDKSSIDLEELKSGGPPKDGIPALLNPKFISINDASEWLEDNEPVIALEIMGIARAYPLQILMWHEIVNDKLNNIPVVATFCPLCYSAIVFNRRVGKNVLSFGVSGLLRNSDMVMYDLFTESFWQQFTGESIVGDMIGKKLELLPSQIISFKQFRDAYPEGDVLSRETGFNRRYGYNPYIGYDDIDQSPFLFDGKEDDRLPPNEKVIAVHTADIVKAYPYSITQERRVINDSIDDKSIVIFHSEGTSSALDEQKISESKDVGSTGVFNSIVNGMNLTFKYEDGLFIDLETNSKWNITGKSIQGKLKGNQLEKILHGDYFAFAWFAFKPETSIYQIPD